MHTLLQKKFFFLCSMAYTRTPNEVQNPSLPICDEIIQSGFDKEDPHA